MSTTNVTGSTPQPGAVESVIDKHIGRLDELTGKLLRLTRDHFERLYGPGQPTTAGSKKEEVPCWNGIYGGWEERLGYSLGKLKQTIDEFNRDGSEALVVPEPPLGFGRAHEGSVR